MCVCACVCTMLLDRWHKAAWIIQHSVPICFCRVCSAEEHLTSHLLLAFFPPITRVSWEMRYDCGGVKVGGGVVVSACVYVCGCVSECQRVRKGSWRRWWMVRCSHPLRMWTPPRCWNPVSTTTPSALFYFPVKGTNIRQVCRHSSGCWGHRAHEA